eukprot:1557527-Pyramimonas_sp.AAC.1
MLLSSVIVVSSFLCMVASRVLASRVGGISMCISRSKVPWSSYGASIGLGLRSCLIRWVM